MTIRILKFIILFGILWLPALSQKDACGAIADPQYGLQYAGKPGQEAEFPGGKDSLNHFLDQHALLIQAEHVSVCDAAKASVEFILKKDGSAAFVKLLKPAACDPLRRYIDEMFSRMPKWAPAKCNGKPVNSKVTVSFKLKQN
ncbi:MAG: energy transducer TonB [Bacteroidia bacterium]